MNRKVIHIKRPWDRTMPHSKVSYCGLNMMNREDVSILDRNRLAFIKDTIPLKDLCKTCAKISRCKNT